MSIPTTAQAAAIRLLIGHPAKIVLGKVVQTVPQDRRKVTPAALASLASRGWVKVPEDGEDGPVVVSEWGLSDAEDREALNLYTSLTYKQQRRVKVSRRPLGRSPIAGPSGQRVGRNVTCWHCVTAAKAEIARQEEAGERASRRSPYEPIWFSNESNAQRAAEIVAGKHYLRHLDGDLPPFEDEAQE